MTAFNLTKSIEELEKIGFWVFVGMENCKLKDFKGKVDNFPVLLMRIVKKDNPEIIKTKPM